MLTRRYFLRTSVAVASAPVVLPEVAEESMQNAAVTLQPYRWEGPYAEYRTQQHAVHDWRLCAEVKADWLRACERLILRTSEVIGHDTGFLYDDHYPSSEPEGRGKTYHHIPFQWQVVEPGTQLAADCKVPRVGAFSIALAACQDFVDIKLVIHNSMSQPMHNPDWAFCAVGFETFSVADPENMRTYLFDGEQLRSLAAIAGRDTRLYKALGANGFIPLGHRALPVGSVQAKASVVIVEAVDGLHSAALGFQQSDTIYGDAKGNRCFHADPYFGATLEPGRESTIRGRLYLMAGNAEAALKRYLTDFGQQPKA